jgi:hypothetical protein
MAHQLPEYTPTQNAHAPRVYSLFKKNNKEEEKDFAGAAGGTQNPIHLSPPDSSQESDTEFHTNKNIPVETDNVVSNLQRDR